MSGKPKTIGYGCQGPIGNEGLAISQLQHAFTLRNELVAIERIRHTEAIDVVHRLAPRLPQLAKARLRAEGAIVNATKGLKKVQKKNAQALKQKIKGLKIKEKQLRLEYAEAIKEELKLHACHPAMITLDDIAREASDEVFKASKATLSTRRAVWLSVQADRGCMPAEQKTFHGVGKLAVQLERGMSWSHLISCRDERVRLQLSSRVAEGKRQKAALAILQVRIGTEAGKRNPVWATVPIYVQGAFPEGSRIQWVYLIRHQSGKSHRWQVQFVVAPASQEAAKPKYEPAMAQGYEPAVAAEPADAQPPVVSVEIPIVAAEPTTVEAKCDPAVADIEKPAAAEPASEPAAEPPSEPASPPASEPPAEEPAPVSEPPAETQGPAPAETLEMEPVKAADAHLVTEERPTLLRLTYCEDVTPAKPSKRSRRQSVGLIADRELLELHEWVVRFMHTNSGRARLLRLRDEVERSAQPSFLGGLLTGIESRMNSLSIGGIDLSAITTAPAKGCPMTGLKGGRIIHGLAVDRVNSPKGKLHQRRAA